jgi:hypothetical protein
MIKTGLISMLGAVALSSGCAHESVASRESPDPAATAAVLRPVPLPAERHGHRVERVSGGLLCCGGFGAGEDRGMHDTLWLAPGATHWRPRAPMIVGRAFFASVVIDDTLYAIGEGVERYDFAADRWTMIVPQGTLPRSHFAAAAVGRTIYVLGGYPVEQSGFFSVDVDRGTVRRLEPPPGFAPGDHFHLMVVIDGVLHVIGGIAGETFTLKTEHWTLGADGWRAQAAAPVGMWAKFAAQAVIGDRLFAFGDFGGYCFDAATNSWSRRAPLPLALVMPAAVVIDGTLWLIGGMRVDGIERAVFLEYDLAGDCFRDRLE